MPSERVRSYEIEYAGLRSRAGNGWAAYIAVYDIASSQVHRNSLIPMRRVCAGTLFATRADAEEAARRRGLSMAGVPV